MKRTDPLLEKAVALAEKENEETGTPIAVLLPRILEKMGAFGKGKTRPGFSPLGPAETFTVDIPYVRHIR